MALLDVAGLEGGYGRLQVLRGVDLQVHEGETAVLLGLNGAGKTTTALHLAGLLRPWAGSIRFGGEEVAGMDPSRLVPRGVVLVPEGRRVFPALSVVKNLRMGAWTHRRDRRFVAERMEQVFGYFPRLSERADQAAGTLSGGEQQMLAIGRGLMSGPRLLVIDEASLGLSPKLAQTVFSIVHQINRAGVTVVMIEQNTGALRIAGRAFIMEKGSIVFGGSPSEVLESEDLRRAYLGAPA